VSSVSSSRRGWRAPMPDVGTSVAYIALPFWDVELLGR
jgi:hypothetical protein